MKRLFRKSVIYQGDIVKEIADLPQVKQNNIPEDLIELIIDDYQLRKIDELLKGNIVDERDLGQVRLSYRKVALNLQDKRDYSIKCVTLLNPRPRAIVLDAVTRGTEESIDLMYKLSSGNINFNEEDTNNGNGSNKNT